MSDTGLGVDSGNVTRLIEGVRYWESQIADSGVSGSTGV